MWMGDVGYIFEWMKIFFQVNNSEMHMCMKDDSRTDAGT